MPRIPLNPCDYLYLAQQQALERRGQGIYAVMVAEAEGRVAHDRVRAALVRVLAAHPVILATLGVSRLLSRPHWRIPPDVERRAARFADSYLSYADCRSAGSEFEPRRAARIRGLYAGPWDLHRGPLMRFEHHDLPGDRTALVLCSPHVLSDAEGGQWLLREFDRLDQAPDSSREDRLLADDQRVDPLAGWSFLHRLAAARRALSREMRPPLALGIDNENAEGESGKSEADDIAPDSQRLTPDPRAPSPDPAAFSYGCLLRTWPREAFKAIKDAARRRTPPGPSLYPRHLAAAVLRALFRLDVERGIHTDVYSITFPRSVSRLAAGPDQPTARPYPGNFLVAPLLTVNRRRAADFAAVAGDIDAQLRTYEQADGQRGQWAVSWLLSAMRLSMYRRLAAWMMPRVPLSAGFSYYGEISPAPRQLFGLPLRNVWGAATGGCPPGLNPIFSQFRNTLNFTLTWCEPLVSEPLARRFADLVEEEAVGMGEATAGRTSDSGEAKDAD